MKRAWIWALVLTVLQTTGVWAQSAFLLQNGQQQFVDANGAPLAGGQVYFYVPSTTTPKITWQDPNQTVPNTNPVVLNAAGRAIIYGSGQYRQVLLDVNGVTIWDQLTLGGIGTGSITNSQLATMPNLTAKGNVSGGVATPSDLNATQITANLVNDCNATTAGRVPTPPNVNFKFLRADCNWSSTPALNPGGRLTLLSGLPVMTTSQSAKSTLYYDCSSGSLVPVFDGTNIPMLPITNCEVSMLLDATVPHVLSGSLYDVFAVNVTNAVALCVGPAWSGSNTRGTGAGTTEITRSATGFFTNANSLTNCWGGPAGLTQLGPVAANLATYLGTLQATANGQTEYVFGGAGVAASLRLWNMYNRTGVAVQVREAVVTYTYTQTAWRSTNGGTVSRLTYVTGLNEDIVNASYQTEARTSGTGVGVAVGVGVSSTVTPTGTTGSLNTNATISQDTSLIGVYKGYPGLGQLFLQGLEALNGTPGTITFTPGDVANGALGGLTVDLRM